MVKLRDMPPVTLAEKLGTTPHISPLLMKARRLGLPTSEHLEALAVARGCTYYTAPAGVSAAAVDRDTLSDEELAIALLSLGATYSPQAIRLGAAMLGKNGLDLPTIVRLTRMERCEVVVRHIAESGQRYEPGNPFWPALLAALPPTLPAKSGVLPHPTRFIAMTGFTRRGPELLTWWIRPDPVPAA